MIFIGSPGRALKANLHMPREIDNMIVLGSNAVISDWLVIASSALVAALGASPRIETSKATVLQTDSGSKSMWQTDGVAIKLTWPVSWALRDARGFAFMTLRARGRGEIMTKSPAEIRREAEEHIRAAREITGASAVVIPDPLTQYREDAEASLAADREELQRRQRKAARDLMMRQRAAAEIDIEARIKAAVATEVAAVLDTLSEAVGSAIGELIKQSIDPVEKKLATLERLLDRLQSLTAPASRSFDGARLDIN